MKVIKLMLFLFFLINQVNAQSNQIRAQARYYSAKSQFEEGDYVSTLISVKESKEILGGTNFLLQYLHIMAAYNNGNYKEAQTEMDKYFRLLDKKEAPISFSRSVEELSSDETTDLVKLLDKIDKHVANNTEERIRIENENRRKEEELRIEEAERKIRMEKEFQDCVKKCFQTIESYLHKNEVKRIHKKGYAIRVRSNIEIARKHDRKYEIIYKEDNITTGTNLILIYDVVDFQFFENISFSTFETEYYHVFYLNFSSDFEKKIRGNYYFNESETVGHIDIDIKPTGRKPIQENCSCLVR